MCASPNEYPTTVTHAHCTGQGLGLELGTMGFCTTLCAVHTTQGQGQGTFFCIVPVPFPVSVPMTFNVYEPLDTSPLFSYQHRPISTEFKAYHYGHITSNLTTSLGCASANSWRLDCFSHSITMEGLIPAWCKTAKIHRNEHSPGIL